MYLFLLQKAWYLMGVQVGLQMDVEGRAVISDPGTSEKVERRGGAQGKVGGGTAETGKSPSLRFSPNFHF